MTATRRFIRERMIPVESPPIPEPMISTSKGFSVSIEDRLHDLAIWNIDAGLTGKVK
jgi:hypothetical protein